MFQDPVCGYEDPAERFDFPIELISNGYEYSDHEPNEISQKSYTNLHEVEHERIRPRTLRAVKTSDKIIELPVHAKIPEWGISTPKKNAEVHKVKMKFKFPELPKALRAVKTSEKIMFQHPVRVDKVPECDSSTQKPQTDVHTVKQEQMGSTELQSVLRALETELDMAEAITEKQKVEAPIANTVSPVLEKSSETIQKKKRRKKTVLQQNLSTKLVTVNPPKVKHQKDSSKSIFSPHKVLGEDVHIARKRYCCHICHTQFFDKCKLIKHMQTHCKNHQNHCILCNYTFTTQSKLKIHMFYEHSRTRVVSFLCKFCQQRFLHETVSNKICKNRLKPYMCVECGKVLVKKTIACQKCSERFEDAVDLVIHYKRSHASAPKSYSRVRQSSASTNVS